MFLNCGEFVQINSDLLATYLFNDLSKTFTNVLQITKFYKNQKKKFLNARAGQTAGGMQICCLLFTDFQWKNKERLSRNQARVYSCRGARSYHSVI